MKQAFRFLVPLALVAVFSAGLCSCGKGGQIATTTDAAAPANEVDAMINDYEKVANEYIRVASRLKGGDMSVTVRYIDLDAQVRGLAAEAATSFSEDDTATSATGGWYFGQNGHVYAEIVAPGQRRVDEGQPRALSVESASSAGKLLSPFRG